MKRINVGDVVLDYAGWRPSSAELAQLKVTCVVRYIAPSSKYNKLITIEERNYLHTAGVAILLVYEWTATRANLGREAGIADGKAACMEAQFVDYPLNMPIIVAIDTDTTAGNAQAQQAYSDAFNKAIFPYTKMGMYGDNDIIQYCIDNKLTVLNWYAGARAWSSYKPPVAGTHVQQVIKGSTPQYDLNNVLLPFDAWLPGEETISSFIHSENPVGDENMINILSHSEPVTFEGNLYSDSQVKWRLLDDGTKRHLLGLEYGILTSNSFKEFKLTNAELDSIPNYPVGSASAAVPTKIRLEGTLSDS